MRGGLGSVFSVNRNGKKVWVAEIVVGYKPDGTRKRMRKTAASKSEAQKLRAELLGQAHNGDLHPYSRETLDSFALWWITTVKAPQVRPATAGDYEARYRHNISPVFGHRKIKDITSRDVANWLSDLSDQGYAVTSINGSRRILSMIFNGAIAFGHIKKNPVKAVPAHKAGFTGKTAVQGPWSREEAKMALHLAKGHPVELQLHLALGMGMRRSEILGLQWSDFDFEHGALHIRRVRREVRVFDKHGTSGTQLETYPPKTPSSARKLNLGAGVFAALLNHRARQQEQGHYKVNGWVFTSTKGTPIGPRRFWEIFRHFTDANGIRRIRFHDLRHTSATLALSGKARIEAVSQFLGHSNIHTTKSIYAPHVEALNEEFVDAIENQLNAMGSLETVPPSPPMGVGGGR